MKAYFPSTDNPIQTDWVNRTQSESSQLLTDFYLERPAYILPDTGLFDVPSINNAPTVENIDRLIGDMHTFDSSPSTLPTSTNLFDYSPIAFDTPTNIYNNSPGTMECRFDIPNQSSFDFSSFSMPQY